MDTMSGANKWRKAQNKLRLMLRKVRSLRAIGVSNVACTYLGSNPHADAHTQTHKRLLADALLTSRMAA